MEVMKRAAFYPTLMYNLARNYVQGNKWPWYTRLDETVIVGALPFKSMAEQLVEQERVGAVVCMNQGHEVEHSWSMSRADWEVRGVQYHWSPCADFDAAPSLRQLRSAVKFIQRFETDEGNRGKSVYIHCKAGRTRSAVVAACYFVEKHQWYANVAMEFLMAKRHVRLFRPHWMVVMEYMQLFRTPDKRSASDERLSLSE